MKRNFKLLLACAAVSVALAACHKPEDAPTGSQPLDYALQVIPDIHEVMPRELINALGEEHLHFGDTPPKLPFPFYMDSLFMYQFIHNTDIDTTSVYHKVPSYYPNRFTFAFFGQHRGVFDTMEYVRDYRYDTIYFGYFHEYGAQIKDVFIMGQDPYFTAYFTLDIKREIGKAAVSNYITDYNIEMTQSTIISGKATPNGIENFIMGIRAEGYSYESSNIGVGLPELHDSRLYQYPGLRPYDTAFVNIHR